jgi:predicted ATP-grasp superfamily ATP-dependent carboligase
MKQKQHTPPFGQFGRVILTYGRSLMALVAAQSLARRGIDVIGCDSIDLTVLQFSRYTSGNFVHADFKEDEDAFVDDLTRAILANAPEDDRPYVLMPMFEETRLLARRITDLPDCIKLAAPSWGAIDRIYPKDNLARTLERIGTPSPATAVIETPEDLAEAALHLPMPLVLKPAEGVGGRGVVFAETMEKMNQAYDKAQARSDATHVLQEAVDGDDYCVTAIAKDGETAAMMAYRNLQTFPAKSGAGTVRETVDHRVFQGPVSMLMKELKWNGVAEFDFRWTGEPSSAPQLIEINPRFWAGLYHSMASGIDYPWLLYQLTAFGDISEHPQPQIGVVTRTPLLSLASAVRHMTANLFRFKKSKRLMSDGWRRVREGRLLDGIREIFGGALKAFNFNAAAFDALEQVEQIKDKPTELDHAPDPFTGLGVMFIFSSLWRTGKLPDEVKY